jgi:molybdenum cofactor biosynthesis enzyme MoaA
VLITGKGEPTLYPNQITNFLKHLKKFDFPLIELQTNGILLGKTSYNKYLKNWFNLGLTLIAISIVHYKNEKNKEIFQPKEDYMNLENLIAKLHKIGFSVRLSCTLVKNYIDNAPELKKLVEWAKDQKIEQLTIRKLAFPKKSQDPKIRNWTTRNVLDKKHLTNMRKYIEKNGNKIMTLPDGAQIYDVSGQNLCLTDALTLEPKTDNLRQIIFFPEGHLRYDWQFEGAVLI